jgi:OFA family oxalate/formate antiporter-like MFS transporter
MKQTFFYGWIVALAAGLGIACGVSVFIPATIGLLVGPLSKELGWAPPAIYFALMLPAVATIVVAPFVGALIDRLGAKRMIAFAFVAEAAIVASFYFLDQNILGFYVRYALFAILGTATTAVSFTVLVSYWFDRRRGLALGIALAGTGFGGAAWSLLVQRLLDQYGWRVSYLFMSMVILAVLAILMLVLKERPESMGQSVDGVNETGVGLKSPRVQGMTLKEASSTKHYWLMLFTFLIVVSAVYSVMLHLVPMLKQRGVSAQAAAGIQASLWIALVFGRIGTGWLMDRFFAPHVAIACLVPSIFGMALLATGATGSTALLAAMLVGAAAGAEIDVVAYLCGRYFGLTHYSTIYGTLFAACALGTAVGPTLAAQLLPVLGGYAGVLWFEIIMVLVGIGLFLCFPRFNKTPVAFEVANPAF